MEATTIASSSTTIASCTAAVWFFIPAVHITGAVNSDRVYNIITYVYIAAVVVFENDSHDMPLVPKNNIMLRRRRRAE